MVQMREDKHRSIGQGNVDIVPLGRTSTAALMASTPYPVEDRLTKKSYDHHISCGVAIYSTVSQPDYWPWD